LNYTIVRYANVYGPRQNPFGEAGVVAIFANKLLKNENPIINGDGKQTRDYVFVEDVVNANVITLSSQSSEIYNVGTGIETSVNELFTMLNSIAGNKALERHGPAPKGEQARSVITSDKLFNEFKWRPSVKIEEGLKKTFDSFKSKI
jgi:UDP-glucose 4-epimerase